MIQRLDKRTATMLVGVLCVALAPIPPLMRLSAHPLAAWTFAEHLTTWLTTAGCLTVGVSAFLSGLGHNRDV